MTETPEQQDEAAEPEPEEAGEPQERKAKLHVYDGPGSRSYPHRSDPETGAVLTVEPGDVFDFGEELPPDDGLWYAVPSDSLPASTGAGETEE